MADSTFRKSVIASVISSVLVIILINPLLRLGWRVMVALGDTVYAGFTNYTYTNAALGQRNWVIVQSLFIFIGLLTGIMTAPFTNRLLNRLLGRSDELREKHKIRFAVIYVILLLLWFTFCISFLVPAAVDLQLNTSFQQRLTVLAAKIPEQEAKELKASWAMMRTRAHYKQIKNRMEALAVQHKVELPRPLID